MKKANLFLATSILTLGLFSCGSSNDGQTEDPASDDGSFSDGRTKELTPEGNNIDTKVGVSKLSKAVETMSSSDELSLTLEKTSTFSISGTSSSTYNDDPTKNVTYNYDVNVTNPLFELRELGLAGKDASAAKASLFLGGDFKGYLQKNSTSTTENINSTNAALAMYLDAKTLYVNPTGASQLIKQVANAYSGKSMDTILDVFLGEKFKLTDAIIDDNMPLIPEGFTKEIDNYLSLFSTHAEDYKGFLSVSQKDATYSFYLTLNKEDLIRVLTDAEDQYAKKDTSDYVPTDYAKELENSTVNAFELLVTFNESAILSTGFNIDMNVVATSDIVSSDNSGSSEVIGKEDTNNHVVTKGKMNFGKDAPHAPSGDYVDAREEFEKYKELLQIFFKDILDKFE